MYHLFTLQHPLVIIHIYDDNQMFKSIILLLVISSDLEACPYNNLVGINRYPSVKSIGTIKVKVV